MDDSQASGSRPLEREIGPGGVDDAGATDAPFDAPPARAGWASRMLANQQVMRGFLLAATLLSVATFLWIGAELHYQGCLQKADVKTPGLDGLSRLARERDVEHCSRLPF